MQVLAKRSVVDAIDSEDEYYVKRRCREKIVRSDTYVLLIGNDTYTKTTYVKWEVEVAMESVVLRG